MYSFGVATLCSARQDVFCSNKLYGNAKLSREVNIHKTHLLLSCTWPSCSQVNDNSRKSGKTVASPLWGVLVTFNCFSWPNSKLLLLLEHFVLLLTCSFTMSLYVPEVSQYKWYRYKWTVILTKDSQFSHLLVFFSVFSPFMGGPDSKDLIVIFYCFAPALLKQVVSQPCSAMTVMLFPSDSCNNKVL